MSVFGIFFAYLYILLRKTKITYKILFLEENVELNNVSFPFKKGAGFN